MSLFGGGGHVLLCGGHGPLPVAATFALLREIFHPDHFPRNHGLRVVILHQWEPTAEFREQVIVSCVRECVSEQ